MNNPDQFNDILDACLDRLARGETPEQCLASYPDQAKELEPLLRTAAALRQAASIAPSMAARANGWRQMSETARGKKPARPSIFAMPRWAVAVAALVLIFIAGGATVGAASGSLPDSLLYPVKLATEKAQLALTFSGIGKTELLVKLADRRVSEISAMAGSGKPDKMAAPARRLDELLAAVAGPSIPKPSMVKSYGSPAATNDMCPNGAVVFAGPHHNHNAARAGITYDQNAALTPQQAGLMALLVRYQAEDPAKLQAVLDQAPPETRALLENIISRYPATYQQAIDTLQLAP